MSVSVVIRTRDSARTLGRLLDDLARQTVPHEVIVVDSGSTDGTLGIVAARGHQVFHLRPEEYTPGRALNAGAGLARAPIIAAVSSHCRLRRPDWLERVVQLHENGQVAATNGEDSTPDGTRFTGIRIETLEDVERHPRRWAFSNHASSWRADVWTEFRFSETLPTAEDKEWAQRVMRRGWTIAYHPDLIVDRSHVWKSGTRVYYRRMRQEAAVMGSYLDTRPTSLPGLLYRWWFPGDQPTSRLRLRLSPKRMIGILGEELGVRDAARARESGAARSDIGDERTGYHPRPRRTTQPRPMA